MIRIIYFCMAFAALSFIAVPVYYGISQEKEKLADQAQAQDVATTETETPLSFEEIYALAEEAPLNPEDLNNIAAAAGGTETPDSFSTGFSEQAPSALRDSNGTPIIEVDNQTMTVIE